MYFDEWSEMEVAYTSDSDSDKEKAVQLVI